MSKILLEKGNDYEISIDSEIFEQLAEHIFPPTIPDDKKGKKFKQLIKEDIDDKMGYRKYKQKLIDAGIFIEGEI